MPRSTSITAFFSVSVCALIKRTMHPYTTHDLNIRYALSKKYNQNEMPQVKVMQNEKKREKRWEGERKREQVYQHIAQCTHQTHDIISLILLFPITFETRTWAQIIYCRNFKLCNFKVLLTVHSLRNISGVGVVIHTSRSFTDLQKSNKFERCRRKLFSSSNDIVWFNSLPLSSPSLKKLVTLLATTTNVCYCTELYNVYIIIELKVNVVCVNSLNFPRARRVCTTNYLFW